MPCQGPQILIDGKYLAMQLIVDGKALGLRQLVASDIHALDTYIQRCKFFGPNGRKSIDHQPHPACDFSEDWSCVDKVDKSVSKSKSNFSCYPLVMSK